MDPNGFLGIFCNFKGFKEIIIRDFNGILVALKNSMDLIYLKPYLSYAAIQKLCAFFL